MTLEFKTLELGGLSSAIAITKDQHTLIVSLSSSLKEVCQVQPTVTTAFTLWPLANNYVESFLHCWILTIASLKTNL
jgi:hypothetical protein